MPIVSGLPSLLLSLPLVAGLSACAAAGPAPVEWRVVVKLPAAESDTAAIARRAGHAAGVPVRYLTAASPEWHALQLSCADDGACRDAVARLKADTRNFLRVERDERRRALTSP